MKKTITFGRKLFNMIQAVFGGKREVNILKTISERK